MKPAISLCLLVLSSTAVHCQTTLRSLDMITYRFTNCNSANHDGPRVINQCLPVYQNSNSPIAAPDTLFQFEDFDGAYDGAQGFHIPRDDLYNITVAGARGGEGVCNFHHGRGGVLSAQVRLTTDYEYLILVGHSGTDVCDVPVNTNNPVCQISRPTTFEDAQACNQSWFSFTSDFESGDMRPRYSYNGGGGGGGASMIRPRNIETLQFTALPIAIAPGGGGASAVLDYQYLAAVLPKNFSYPRNSSAEEVYQFHVDGHFNTYFVNWPVGGQGSRLDQEQRITSGAGGGWELVPLVTTDLDADGNLLSQRINFAQGGFDCSARLDAEVSGAKVFTNVFGGYGGGGGGCGSGGGGGGHTGGHLVTSDNRVPGGGGDIEVFNNTELTLVRMLEPSSRFNDGEGFVEIVPSNCGCAGQCVVYTNESQFECLCPNGTVLADDLFNCYIGTDLTVEEGELTPLPLFFKRLITLDSAVELLSIRVDVTTESIVQTSQDQFLSSRCLIVLYGERTDTILISNIVSGSGTIDTLSVIKLDSSGNVTMMSVTQRMLESPVLVTGMILLSTDRYRLASSIIRADISILSSNNTSAASASILSDEVLVALARRVFIVQPEEEIPPTGAIVGAVVGSVLGIVLMITICVLIGAICYKREQSKKHSSFLHTLSPKRKAGSGMLELNSAYVLYQANPTVVASSMDHTYETISVAYAEVENGTVEVLSTSPPRRPGRCSNAQFEPAHGITSPQVDFCAFNMQRSSQDWSYPRSNLVYMRELGEGQFGKVLLMKAKNIAGYQGTIPVAVKTLASRDPDVIQKFMEEAELMKKFNHSNIVSLLGFINQEDDDEAPLMVLEFMQYGDLHNFLVSNRPGPNKKSFLTKMHFYIFTYDIANGLEFLSSHQYVHRDIAARNCLVGSGLQIKIADFGLARGINNKDYYRIAGSAVLPVRWMSPESLLLGKFSTASDVWSYGVVIWEILMFGQLPLPDMDTPAIIKAVQNGTLEHPRPHHAPEDLYSLISSCHQLQVEDRPSFREIIGMELFNVLKKRPSLPSDIVVIERVADEQCDNDS